MPPSQAHVLGIIGVRDLNGSLYTNSEYVYSNLNAHVEERKFDLPALQIVTGGGRGVESMVIDWAERLKVPYRTIPPNIQELGPKKSFIVRNKKIVFQCTELVVFWDGCTEIVTEALTTATHAGRRVTIIPLQ